VNEEGNLCQDEPRPVKGLPPGGSSPPGNDRVFPSPSHPALRNRLRRGKRRVVRGGMISLRFLLSSAAEALLADAESLGLSNGAEGTLETKLEAVLTQLGVEVFVRREGQVHGSQGHQELPFAGDEIPDLELCVIAARQPLAIAGKSAAIRRRARELAWMGHRSGMRQHSASLGTEFWRIPLQQCWRAQSGLELLVSLPVARSQKLTVRPPATVRNVLPSAQMARAPAVLRNRVVPSRATAPGGRPSSFPGAFRYYRWPTIYEPVN
jgi:hypothetical protein